MGLEQRLVTQASLSASPAALMVSMLRARAAELRPGDARSGHKSHISENQ